MSGQGQPLNHSSAEPRCLENHAMGNPVACCGTKSRALACMLHAINMACSMSLLGGMGESRGTWGATTQHGTHGDHTITHQYDSRKWPEKWDGRGRDTINTQCGCIAAHTQMERGKVTQMVAEVTQHGPGRPLIGLQRVPPRRAAQMRGSTPRDKMALGSIRWSTTAVNTLDIARAARDCMRNPM